MHARGKTSVALLQQESGVLNRRVSLRQAAAYKAKEPNAHSALGLPPDLATADEGPFENIASIGFFRCGLGPAQAVAQAQFPATNALSPATAAHLLVAPEYATGTSPESVAVGDVNGDGIADLAVANFGSNSVSILLGNGDGSFASHVDYPTGKGPSSVALADVNNDGKLDVIVSDATDGAVSVLKGNGDGSFQAHVDFPAGTSPTSVVVSDFNGDSKPDVLIVNPAASSFSGAISLLIGNGDGTFQAAVSYSVASPVSASTADFNGDGKADLVVANSTSPGSLNGSLMVFLGKGDGSFQPGVAYILGNVLGPLSVTIADLNGDGKMDLIAPTSDQVTIPGPGSVTVLLGNGDGTFKAPLTYKTDRAGAFSKAFATTGDFDGDGRMDVAIASSADNTVSVLLGNGDGTFRSQVNFGTESSPSFLAAGDFNGDGHVDLVTPNSNANNVSVLLGNGTGTFQARVDYGVGMNPDAVATGDFNGDGEVDIVTADIYSGMSLLLGNGDGTFRQRLSYATASISIGIVAGDFNHDNKLDVATANISSSAGVGVLLGNGDGTFQPRVDYVVPHGPASFSSHALVAADFIGDGALDLVVAGGGHVSLLLNVGNGTFQPAIDLGVTASSVVSADFNGDGKADLAIAGAQVAVLLGNGDGTFQAPIYLPGSGTDVAIGDFDGNGKTDVVVLRNVAFSVLLGNGDGTFLPPVDYPVSASSSIAVGDLNGDGHPDIVVSTASVPGISVFLNNGDGTFQTGFDYTSGPGPGLAMADFNGDGKLDVSVANQVKSVVPFLQDGLVSVLLNGQFALVGVASSKNPAPPGQPISFTAKVSPSTVGPSVPTGTIVLQDGSATIASAALSGGAVTFPPATLSAGTHPITARYSGDQNFRPASGGIRQVIAAPDFSLVASGLTPVSIRAGQSASATLTLTSVGGFSGMVAMSCSVSPVSIPAPSCALNPGSLQVGTGSAVQSTLTVSTLAAAATFTPNRLGLSARWSFARLICFPVIVLVGWCGTDTSRGCPKGRLLVGILLFAAGLQIGCGGGSQQKGIGSGGGTPPGTYTITVQATSGASQHATTLALTVN